MRPDGSIQFPCAFVQLHRGAPEMSLREIYNSPEVRKIIMESPEMWDFCKGCKNRLPVRSFAYRNSPLTAVRSHWISSILVSYRKTAAASYSQNMITEETLLEQHKARGPGQIPETPDGRRSVRGLVKRYATAPKRIGGLTWTCGAEN